MSIFLRCLLPLSLFSLAASIVFFTLEISKVRQGIPEIASTVNSMSQSILPMVEEAQKVSKEIPEILIEVKAIREETIPSILKETSEIRGLIPPILKEVELVRADLPKTLQVIDNMASSTHEMSVTVTDMQPLISDALDEAKATRKSIPPMLSEVDRLLNKAGNVGQQTSEGAVTGVVTGIVKAPFKLFGGIFNRKATQLEPSDMDALNIALSSLVSLSIGSSKKWDNSKTQRTGILKILDNSKIDNEPCKKISHIVTEKGKKLLDDTFTVCKSKSGAWDVH